MKIQVLKIKLKSLFHSLLLLTLAILACSESDTSTSCENAVIISSDAYNDAPTSDEISIENISIIDDCLHIAFGLSGCDGTDWNLDLIDSDFIVSSDDTQRFLKLILKNNEECEAFFMRETSFDISELQIGGGQVLLKIVNHNMDVVYSY